MLDCPGCRVDVLFSSSREVGWVDLKLAEEELLSQPSAGAARAAEKRRLVSQARLELGLLFQLHFIRYLSERGIEECRKALNSSSDISAKEEERSAGAFCQYAACISAYLTQ